MATLLNALFAGANGVAINTQNSAFTNLVEAGWTFSNAQTVPSTTDTVSGKQTTTTASTSIANVIVTSSTATYFRAYLYVAQRPAGNTTIGSLLSSTGMAAELQLTAAGAFRLRRSGDSVTIATSPADTAPAAGWCRIEWRYDSSALQQELRVYSGANLHSTSPSYTSGPVTTAAGGAVVRMAIGAVTSAVMTTYWNRVVVSDSTWVGSAVATSNVAPTVTMSANLTNVAAGAQVTHTATATDTDGTVASMVWEPPTGVAGVSTSRAGNVSTLTYLAPSSSTLSTLTSRITVTDDGGLTASGAVTAAVLAQAQPPSTYLLEEHFEGANGTAISAGPSAFSTLVEAGWTYSTAQVLQVGGGNSSGRCVATGAGTGIASGPIAATDAPYLRFYYFSTNRHSTYAPIARFSSAGAPRGEMRLGPTGQLQLRDSNLASFLVTTAEMIPLNEWVRVEWHYDNTAGTQRLRVFSGTRLHSLSPSYDSGTLAAPSSGTVAGIGIGCLLNTAVLTAYFDEIAVSATGWVGPSAGGIARVDPIADPGPDFTVDPNLKATIDLDPSASIPGDGPIVQYDYDDVTGGGNVHVSTTNSPTVVSVPVPTSMTGATRTYKLTTTDDIGTTSTDTVVATVKPHAHWHNVNGVRKPRRRG